MVYTHDKYGKPIPPQVLDILNMPVPLKPRKKRARPGVGSCAPTQRSKIVCETVPHITEVPDLCSRSLRKQPSVRVPCESPLESPLESPRGVPLGVPELSDLSLADSASTMSTESDSASTMSTESLFSSDSESSESSSSSPLAWLKSMLESVKAVKEKGHTVTKVLEDEKEPIAVKNDSPEWSGCTVLETFKITQKPGYTAPTRSPRLNSDFYRILALENAMCIKGKLGHPSVSMLIEPRNDPDEPQFVLGIQQTLPRRRERRWRELTGADFS